MNGTVTRVFLTRGFGFLRGEDGVERFIHVSTINGNLAWEQFKTGMKVTFDPVDGKKGPRAENIQAQNGPST